MIGAAVASERNDAALASQLLALGFLDRYLAYHGDRALFESHRNGAPLVAFGASLSLVQTSSTSPDPAVVKTLLDAITSGAKPVPGFPWNGGNLRRFGAVVLAEVAKTFEDPKLARTLFEAMSGDAVATELAVTFIDDAFGDEKQGLPKTARELTGQQLALLTELASIGINKFANSQYVARALERHGIVYDTFSNALQRLLGLSPKGPLDREVEGEPLWRILRRVQDGLAPESVWLEAVSSLPPSELLDVCADAASDAYLLWQPWPPKEQTREDLKRYSARRIRLLARTVAASRASTAEILELATRLNSRTFSAVALVVFAGRGEETFEARFDPLLHQAMWFDDLDELRLILAALPLDRRAAVVLANRPIGVPFRLLDLVLEADGVAEKIIGAVKSWQPGAEVPDALAVDLLGKIGTRARALVEAALAEPKLGRPDVLERALEKIGSRG